MKKITYLLVLLIISACQKEENTNTTPAYIKIDTITLDENNTTTNITDAWVYINDQLQGVYELPATFPVLKNDIQTLRIKAGIKSNGIASSRIAYPFYASFINTVMLTPNQTITVNPTVSYLDSLNFWVEDFEEAGVDLETTVISDTTLLEFTDSLGNQYGGGVLNDSLITFEIATDELLDLPQAGAPVFLELDYKCNTEFLVGMYVNFPQSVLQKDLLWINAKDDWNKIYINLTSTISEGVGAESFKVFIGMKRGFSLDKNELYFDNVKLVY
jgi:hypothetical protein